MKTVQSTNSDFSESIDFQRYILNTLKPTDDPRTGPNAVNVIDPETKQPLTNLEFFNLHARLLAILEERRG